MFLLSVSTDLMAQLDESDTLRFSAFPSEFQLSFEPAFKLKGISARKMFLVDSSLMVWNANGAEDHFFYRYSLAGERLPGGYIKGGQGHGEVTGAMSGGVLGNTLWLHDLVLDKLVTVNFSSSPGRSDSGLIRDYRMPLSFYSVQLTDSAHIIGSGVYDSPSKMEGRALNGDTISRQWGSFRKPPAGIPFNSWKNAYESFVFVNPSGKKAALVCRFTDQVELFDLPTGKSRLISGPEQFDVSFDPIVVAGMDMMERNRDTRFAFLNGTVTPKYLYLLYSGLNHETTHINTGKWIYVYDWDGNPVKKIGLDRFITSFVVAEDDQTIFAYDPASSKVLKAFLSDGR